MGARVIRWPFGWPWLAVAAGVVCVAAISFLDDDSGVRAWLRYRDDLATARARIEVLRAEVRELEEEARRLRDDPITQERAIREDLGLALPGDVVVVLPRSPEWQASGSPSRLP